MADITTQKIMESTRLRTMSMYLQAVYADFGRQPTEQELVKAMEHDIQTLSELALQQLEEDKSLSGKEDK